MGVDNPHDTRLKELFANKKSFISLLRDCIKEPWINEINEESINKTNNSFILQDFSSKEADVVYEGTIKGNKVIFYILMELQSKVDYRMPYRLLLYVVEILRYFYNHADAKERERKDFKFPVVVPLVFFTGSDRWTVPPSIKEMFADSQQYGKYVLDFEYLLLDVKGYDNERLKTFSSRLLGVILLLEKSKNDIEFYSNIRHSLEDIGCFDKEEKRIFDVCVKIMDMAYGYNKGKEIKELLDAKLIKEADSMLCDVIENAKYEKEQLITRGRVEGKLESKLEVAKKLLMENLPIDFVVKITELPKEQVEALI